MSLNTMKPAFQGSGLWMKDGVASGFFTGVSTAMEHYGALWNLFQALGLDSMRFGGESKLIRNFENVKFIKGNGLTIMALGKLDGQRIGKSFESFIVDKSKDYAKQGSLRTGMFCEWDDCCVIAYLKDGFADSLIETLKNELVKTNVIVCKAASISKDYEFAGVFVGTYESVPEDIKKQWVIDDMVRNTNA